jgi:phasin family protein
MQNNTQQFTELQRKNMDAGMKLAQMSIENSQRIVALQVDAAKKLFQDSVENAKALAAAKDPQQAVALQTQFAQDTAKKMMETAQKIAELGNASRTEFSHLLTEQLTSGSQDMMASFQSFFGAIPGQNSSVLDAMKKAMTNANAAFEQITQASTAFVNAGAAKSAPKKK